MSRSKPIKVFKYKVLVFSKDLNTNKTLKDDLIVKKPTFQLKFFEQVYFF